MEQALQRLRLLVTPLLQEATQKLAKGAQLRLGTSSGQGIRGPILSLLRRLSCGFAEGNGGQGLQFQGEKQQLALQGDDPLQIPPAGVCLRPGHLWFGLSRDRCWKAAALATLGKMGCQGERLRQLRQLLQRHRQLWRAELDHLPPVALGKLLHLLLQFIPG